MSDWRVPGYTEETELGRGGSGRVVAAVEMTSGDRVAIKYLSDRLAADEVFRAAFRAEAEILAQLNVPHVTKVRRYVESADGGAIIMDLVAGVALRRILAEFGTASPRAALSVLKGSLQGLAAAHEAGIVHRDYKPENVIVDQAGSSMLVDFGIALRAGTPGNPAGTPGYAAPEQWDGAPASPAGDIYAAGMTFIECVTGTGPPRGYPAPVSADSAGETGPAGQEAGGEVMGPSLAGLISRATAADPAARPADAAALLAELEESADDRYGAGWEAAGRADLARAVAAVLGAAAGAAAGAAMAGRQAGPASAAPAEGPATDAATTLARPGRFARAARPGRFARAARAGGKRGPARGLTIGVAAGVVVVTGIAVAITTQHHGSAHASPGSSRTTGAPTPSSSPTTPAASKPKKKTIILSGKWSGQYSGTYTGTFKLRWHQTGSHLHGTITISNPLVTLPINGTVNGRSIKFGTVGSAAISYTGTVSGRSMSGTYRVNGSAGGPWHAIKV